MVTLRGDRHPLLGQSMTEFILVLGILAAVGIYLMNTLAGSSHSAYDPSGSIGVMHTNAVQAVQKDTD